MRVCVYGAGAIGGAIAVRLHAAGVDVTCIARGPHLAAMREHGLKLIGEGEETVARVRCTDDPREAGPHDYVLVTLKTHSAAKAAGAMRPLLGPETAVVTAQNGVPWWYFYKHGGPHDGARLRSTDPDGQQWDLIGPERAIGCVLYLAAEVIEPGVVRHQYDDRLSVGEPDGSRSERVRELSEILTTAGFRAPVRPRIRDEIWLKLWGNVSFNPLSVLTHGTLIQLATDPEVKPVARAMMIEAHAVAEALGVGFPVDVDTRIQWAADVGEHKTSMLQDLELGRPMEIDAMVTAVQELGRLVAVATPTIDAVLSLVKMRARVAGCYDG
ncbi:MAG: 2-dehydropantoate 2-reductase [Alphaproteobacteria bacterium]